MAKQKLRGTFVFPAGGASQANVDKTIAQATDEIKETVYKSVAGLEVELNKAASVTANGTLVVEPSDGKDVMEKATVTVAIPLEDNKAATIDVSQYASAVEVTPTDGKTAMKKTTVTLSNIPVLESNKAATIDVSQYSEAVEVTPSSNKDAMEKTTVTLTNIPTIESSKAATIDVSAYTEPVEIEPTEGKDGMAKAVVTLSDIPDIEDNKTATIDVSAYTEPIEIEPTEGKDGMKKTTVTLSNIPSGDGYDFTENAKNTFYVFTLTLEGVGTGHFLFIQNGYAVDDLTDLTSSAKAVLLEGGEPVFESPVTISGSDITVEVTPPGSSETQTYTGTTSAESTTIESLLWLIAYNR